MPKTPGAKQEQRLPHPAELALTTAPNTWLSCWGVRGRWGTDGQMGSEWLRMVAL